MDLHFQEPPASGAKNMIFKQLHHGRKWFDSGEYFLAKEGKQCPDLLPGGAPVEMAEPKLAPSTPTERKATKLVNMQKGAPPRQAQSSEY